MKIQLNKSKKKVSSLMWRNHRKETKTERKVTKCKNEGIIWLSVDDLIKNLSKQPEKYLPLVIQILRELKEKGEINGNDLIKHQNFVFSLEGARVVRVE